MLIHLDGFDSYSTGSDLNYQYGNIGASVNTTGGRFGQGALTITSYNQLLTKSFDNTLTEVWIGFAIKTAFNAGEYSIISFVSPSGIEAALGYNAGSNTWFMGRNGAGGPQIGASGVRTIGDNNWHFIELHYKIDSAVGIAELWIDNTVVFNNTGVNTTYYGNTTFTTLHLFGGENSGIDASFDDLYIIDATTGPNNTTRLGDSRIQTLRPSGDAGPNDGTPSTAGPHYAMVNEPQNDGGATYITVTGTSGQEELFNMTSLVTTPSSIFGARVLNYAEKTDAGTLNTNAVISSNGIVANGNTQALLTGFSGMYGIFETDPNTGSAWTPTAINSADCGFKIA